MFVASTRIDSVLPSEIWKDFWMFPSRNQVPNESSVRFPSVPICPGLGLTRTFTTDDPSDNTTAPGVPAGTFMARALSVQNPASDEATRDVSAHWGSRCGTNLSPKNVPVLLPAPSHLTCPSGISQRSLATT